MKALLAVAALAVAAGSYSAVITIEATQVGGFFADGPPSNTPEFQNYFVGYGTTPGFARTSERRSFFHYDVPTFAGEILSAKVSLKLLVSTSLIFGKGPGDPMAGPLPEDEFETFQLGVTPLPASMVTSLGLSAPEWAMVFDSFNDIPVAAPKTFLKADPLPLPAVIEIELDAFGKMAIDMNRGSDMVLTGWMPSWSPDFRVGPGGTLVEGSELIFGFSDVPDLVPKPTLTIEYAPVPEPATLAALATPLVALLRRRK